MTHEERLGRIEQKLEFLAGNQAQLWADLQELQQISRRHSAQIAEVGSFILRLGRVVEEQGRRAERRHRGGSAAAREKKCGGAMKKSPDRRTPQCPDSYRRALLQQRSKVSNPSRPVFPWIRNHRAQI